MSTYGEKQLRSALLKGAAYLDAIKIVIRQLDAAMMKIDLSVGLYHHARAEAALFCADPSLLLTLVLHIEHLVN